MKREPPSGFGRRRRILRALGGCCVLPGYAIAASAQAPQDRARRSFDLRIERRKLAAGPAVVRATQGDIVDLRWTTDEATTVHLHGYDLEARLEPGKPGVMTIDARATGRFPLAAHGFGAQGGHRGETTLLYLEVYPR